MRPSEFQHTAARRRLDRSAAGAGVPCVVSTHSRPKAAGAFTKILMVSLLFVSTHSRPKAAGVDSFTLEFGPMVSTHSRPKAAGFLNYNCVHKLIVSTHSRPKAAGRAAYTD